MLDGLERWGSFEAATSRQTCESAFRSKVRRRVRSRFGSSQIFAILISMIPAVAGVTLAFLSHKGEAPERVPHALHTTDGHPHRSDVAV